MLNKIRFKVFFTIGAISSAFIVILFLSSDYFLAVINTEHWARMRWFYIALFFWTVLMSILFAVVVDRLVTAPLTKLKNNIENMSKILNISARLEVSGSDEVSCVAGMINKLLDVVENSQVELARKNKLEGIVEMGGTICHEINQPLTALTGYIDVLLLKVPAEQTAIVERVHKIKTEAQRLGDLTRKLNNVLRKKEFIEKEYYKDIKILDIHTD